MCTKRHTEKHASTRIWVCVQVARALDGFRAAASIGKAAADICSELNVELQAGGSAGGQDAGLVGGRQGEVENADPSPNFGRVESEVERLLAVLSALRGSIGEALGKLRGGGERKREGGGGEEAGPVVAGLEVPDVDISFPEIDIGTALWGRDGEDEKAEDLVGVEDLVQSLEGLLQEALRQGSQTEEATCALDVSEGEEGEEAELRAWLHSDPLPRLPSPPPHWKGGESGGGGASLSAWKEGSSGEGDVARVLLYGGATPLPPPEGHSMAQDYAAQRSPEEVWAMLHNVLCWSPCPPPWLSAVATGLLETLPSLSNPSLHHAVLRALGGEGQGLETLLESVASAACIAVETGKEGERGEVGRCLQVLAAQLVSRGPGAWGQWGGVASDPGPGTWGWAQGWEWCYNCCIRDLLWPPALQGTSQTALLCLLDWLQCTARYGEG